MNLQSIILSISFSIQATVQNSVIKPLEHHALLLLLLQLAVLLLVARSMGELMRRINLPPVVGELLAGVVLGPSLFGAILPATQIALFPHSQDQSNLLGVVSWLGVLFLLVATGLETDLNLVLRKGKTALLISLGGIILPFISGFSLGWVLPENLLANPSQRLVFSLFIATAMSITAVPVIAKVLMDLDLIRRDIGQITLAAGMTDDTMGWILLSVVSGLAHSGEFDLKTVVASVSSAILFLGLAFTLGRTVIDRIFRWTDDHIGGVTASLSMTIILGLFAAALTHGLGLEAALGAFIVGILVGESRRFNREAGHILEVITSGFLAPIFFAAAGLKVDLRTLFVPETLLYGSIVLAIACIGKFVGAYVGSRLGGLSHWEGLAMGSGMNARGAMEIIVATIGLSLGVLNLQMYSIIVMVAIITSLMAPPLLRLTLSKVAMGEEEASRLEQEELSSRSFAKQIKRVLMPTRGGNNVQIAAQMVSCLAHQNPLEVTALYVHRDKKSLNRTHISTVAPAKDTTAEMALAVIEQEVRLPPESLLKTKTVSSVNTPEAILSEAQKGYDLIVLGATEQQRIRGSRFNIVTDRIIQAAPCAVMVVKSHLPQAKGDTCIITKQEFRHILVPTVGSDYSKNAVEIACTIAAQTQAMVSLINVISVPQVEYVLFDQQRLDDMHMIAINMLEQQAQLGRSLGANVTSHVIKGNIPEHTILKFAQAKQADLIVIGSALRMVTGRVFMGHRVDTILDRARCPVAVIIAG
jgi:Kef-type K+ transport system membrane component KefB/nucleotide-binding universal stress UspA family protein